MRFRCLGSQLNAIPGLWLTSNSVYARPKLAQPTVLLILARHNMARLALTLTTSKNLQMKDCAGHYNRANVRTAGAERSRSHFQGQSEVNLCSSAGARLVRF